jgi:serine phosphatase RsbU (regulator of sigma subunit)
MNLLIIGATTCFLLAGVTLFLGVAIFLDAGRERLHRVTSLMLFFGGLGAILVGLGLAARASTAEGIRLYAELAIYFAPLWEFFFPALLVFALVFPTEHPWLKRIGWLPEFIFGPYVFHLLLTLLAYWSGGDFFLPELSKQFDGARFLVTPLRVGLTLIYSAHTVLFSFVNIGYVLVSLGILWTRARRVVNPRLRDQVRTIRVGLAVCLIAYTLAVPLPTILGRTQQWERFSAPLLVAALLAGSGSIAYSIIRHRFLDTRLFLRRSIVFVVTAGVVAALYLGVYSRVEAVLGGFTGIDVRFVEPLFLMTALVLLPPLAARVEDQVNRWVGRHRRESRVVIEQLSRDVVTLMDLPAIGARLTQSLFESLACDGVGVIVRPPRGAAFERIAATGFAGTRDEAWPALAERLGGLAGLEGPIPVQRLITEEGEGREALVKAAEALPAELFVPLAHGGELLGALVLGPKSTRTRYTREDLDVLSLLGNQTAAAVRNSHLLAESLERAALEEELHLARQIQFSYLPQVFPRLERVEFAGTNVPSKQVGGDYYDYIETDHGLMLTIADVVGKGVPAALLMSMLQASLRTLAIEGRTLAEMAAYLNRLILRSGIEGKFATCFLARLDLETLTLHYTNAGHNPPCLLREDGRVEWLTHGGLLLGVFDDARVSETVVHLEPGDRLVLYTDGVTEAADAAGEMFGEERLVRVLEQLPQDTEAAAVVQEVMRAIHEFCGGREPGDDITVVVLRVPQAAAVLA